MNKIKYFLVGNFIFLWLIFIYYKNYIFAEETPINSCIESCHQNEMGGKFKHFAAFERCTNCHKPYDSTQLHPQKGKINYFLSHEKNKLCFTCHPQKGDTVLHEPYGKGECIKCHSPHSTNYKKQLLFDSKELCSKCHKTQNTFFTAHSDYKNGNCITCHNPHASNQIKIIRKSELCITCHNKDVTEPIKMSNVNLFTKLRFQHFPEITKKCTNCHNPHYSENKRLFATLKSTELKKTQLIEDVYVCFNCHNTTLFTDSLANNATRFHNFNRNLHFVHIKTKRISNCNLCHQVHGTQNPHLIREFGVMGNWKNPINYTQNETGGSCSSGCHKQYSYNNQIKISRLATVDFAKHQNTTEIIENLKTLDPIDFDCLKNINHIKTADNDTIFSIATIYSNMNQSSNVFKISVKPLNIKEYNSNLSLLNNFCYNLLSIQNVVVLSSNQEINSIIKTKINEFLKSENTKFNIRIINKNRISITSLINSIYLCLLNNGLKLENINFEIKEEFSVHIQKDLYLVLFIE